MNKYIIIISLFIISCNRIEVEYPKIEKIDQIDNYFGIEISDPYQWLEDENSEETKKWIEIQRGITSNYLSQIPFRDNIKKRLIELSDYARISTPKKMGGCYFYEKNEGLQDQSILFMLKTLDAEPEVVIDPNELSDDGSISLTNYSVSKDSMYLAYSVASAGSDWCEVFVLNLKTGETLQDHVKWLKSSDIAWFKDGFFYSKYPELLEDELLSDVNKNNKVYYHKIGQNQEDDELIHENRLFPFRNFNVEVVSDEKYLIIYEMESTSGNSMFIKNLEKKNSDVIQLTTGFDYDYNVVGNEGEELFVLTNYKSPKYKLIKININVYDVGNWKDVIPEKKEVLKDCYIAGGKFFTKYITDAYSKIGIYSIEGTFENELDLPEMGSLISFCGEKESDLAFYSYSSFLYPNVVYKYSISKNISEVYFKPVEKFDFDKYETTQVFFESKDETKIPMFIVHKKGLSLNGNNPTLLYGYGGFNISLTPWFKVDRLLWLENNGVFALANIRGGGEYGERWHQAGMRLNKQNVFDDFICAAEYLIKENYTSSKKLAIQGASNGGLLVAVVTNQRPDLFRVALPAVGVMDMLRYHKFTIGWAWIKDYGSSEDSIDFMNLYSYSPIHNIVEEVNYPSIMVTTADHDDRVVPAHSYKYTSTLQEKQTGKNPALIRIQSKAGHGSGKPISVKIEENTDIITFAFYNMGISPKE